VPIYPVKPIFGEEPMQITVEVPDELGEKLHQFRDRLPEILAHALQELSQEPPTIGQDDQQIIQLLASQPSPEEILAIRPTPALQSRMSELLDRNKSGNISRPEETELDRYLVLEHLVRLAKAHAYKRLQTAA
jgi:hypothetical protein